MFWDFRCRCFWDESGDVGFSAGGCVSLQLVSCLFDDPLGEGSPECFLVGGGGAGAVDSFVASLGGGLGVCEVAFPGHFVEEVDGGGAAHGVGGGLEVDVGGPAVGFAGFPDPSHDFCLVWGEDCFESFFG